MKTKTIELTAKEAYLLWSIACWFGNPVTSELKYKLAKIVEPNSAERKKFDKKFEKEIISQLAETGVRIKKNHPEWLLKKRT